MKAASNKAPENAPEKREVWVAIAKVTVGIMIFPAVCYFFFKLIILEGILGVTHPDSNFWAATIAIIIAHVVLGVVVYVAFWEKPEKRELPKRD